MLRPPGLPRELTPIFWAWVVIIWLLVILLSLGGYLHGKTANTEALEAAQDRQKTNQGKGTTKQGKEESPTPGGEKGGSTVYGYVFRDAGRSELFPTNVYRYLYDAREGGNMGYGNISRSYETEKPRSQEVLRRTAAGKTTAPTADKASRQAAEEGKAAAVNSSRSLPSRGGDSGVHSYAGIFLVTAYTHTGNKTKSETWPAEGRTIATDPEVIPTGSLVRIEGLPGEYLAEDTGGAIKNLRIDLFLDTEAAAVKWGRQNRKVWIIKKGAG